MRPGHSRHEFSRGREDAIRILAALMTSMQNVVEHRVTEIFEVLLECASDHNAVVTTHALLCLAQLTAVGFKNIGPQRIHQIMSILLTSLEGDTRPAKRSAALDCLGQLCTNSGYVITPLEDYPRLLPLLHQMLRREQSRDIRLQVIRVIGLLGAMDPYHYQVTVPHVPLPISAYTVSQVKVQGVVVMEFPPEAINAIPNLDVSGETLAVASDDPYQGMVVDLLVDILQQRSLSSHHHLVIDSLITIAKTQGVTFAAFVPKVRGFDDGRSQTETLFSLCQFFVMSPALLSPRCRGITWDNSLF